MEPCKNDLVTEEIVPRHVKRCNRYKIYFICAVLTLVVQLCLLVNSFMCLSSRDIKTCSESDRTIWIPRKNGNRDSTSADSSRFYCQTVKHKLAHLIDFLVVANRSTVEVPDNTLRTMMTDNSRPVTRILHIHPIDGRRFSNEFYLKGDNDVRVSGNGSVTIKQDGVYCVYGIVTFVHAPREIPNDQYRIDRIRRDNHTAILSDTIYKTKHLEAESYNTIDLSGNFLLMKGDVLNPVVRNISAVYSFSPANYWGVYQVRPETHS